MLAIPNAVQFEKSELSREESSKCPYCAEIIKYEVVMHRYCCSEMPIATKESHRKEIDTHSEQFTLAFNLVNDNQMQT